MPPTRGAKQSETWTMRIASLYPPHRADAVCGEPAGSYTRRTSAAMRTLSSELIRTKVAALVDRGAIVVREERYSDERGSVLGHVVMLDPEGNEFCVA